MQLEKTIGIAIAVSRIQKQMKQKELAHKIGVSSNYMCLIEKGKRLPSLSVIDKICTELDITKIELMSKAESLKGYSGVS